MKASTTIMKKLALLLLLLVAKSAFSQAPTYNVYVTNECYPTVKTFRCDIWLKETGSGVLDIANIGFRIGINPTLRGANTITPSIVTGSSMFTSSETPEGVAGIITYDNATETFTITARANPGCSSGTIIPNTDFVGACRGPGIRFCTVELATSATSFPTGVTPNLTFTSIDVLTLISYYPQPCPSNGADGTAQGTFLSYNSPGTCSLNPGANPLNCTTILTTAVNALTNPTCFGSTNGSFNISNTFTNLLNGHTRYSLNGTVINTITGASATNLTFSGLGQGVYLVLIERGPSTLTNTAGTPTCSATIYVTISNPTPGPLAIGACAHTNESCVGADGTATAGTVSNSVGTVNYHWSNGAATSAITGLVAGTYTLTVTDNCGSVTCSQTVGSFTPIHINSAVPTCASCANCTDGIVTVNVTGGDGSNQYDYYISDPGYNTTLGPFTSNVITGLAPGNYVVDVTDLSGNCSADNTSFPVTVCVGSTCAMTASASATDVSCFGGSNGTASVTAASGAGTLTYHWSNNASTSSISGLVAGSYCVTVTDANTCTATACTSVNQPTALSASCSGTPVSCNGSGNGSASVAASGGTPAYTYHWSNNAATSSISSLAAGTYSVTVTDSHSCTATCAFTVTQPTALSAVCSGTHISCNGGSNGAASVVASGGSPGYTYHWSNNAATSGITGVAAGTYSVTVTDTHSCTASCSFTVTQPTALSASASSNSPICSGTSLNLSSSASGGSSPYSFSWSGPNSFSSTLQNPVRSNSPLANAGTYTVTITDSHSCTATATTTVTVNNCSVTLNLKCYLEGFYVTSTGFMRTPLFDLGISADPTATDTIYVGLYNPAHLANPSADYSQKVIIHKDGTSTVTFTDDGNLNGHSFYIQVRHRNTLETWSKTTVAFTTTTSYDFSTAQIKAYDDGINQPMRSIGNGAFGFYGGDVNQDGDVNLADMAIVDNDTQNFLFGYNRSDVNGDRATGVPDMTILDNNINVYSFPPLHFARP